MDYEPGTDYADSHHSDSRRRVLFECAVLAAMWFGLAFLSWPLLHTAFPIGVLPYLAAALGYPVFILITPSSGLGRHGLHLAAMAAGMGLSLALQADRLGDGFFLYPVVAVLAAFGAVSGLVALAIRKGRENSLPSPGNMPRRSGLEDL